MQHVISIALNCKYLKNYADIAGVQDIGTIDQIVLLSV
jgi:hypothetical protein